jgi:hypothetical protein
VKDKGHPITGHDGPCVGGTALQFLNRGAWWGGVVSTTPRPLYPRKRHGTLVQEAGWVPGPVLTCAKNLAPTRIRFPDRTARSQSLYRLSHPAHTHMCAYIKPVHGSVMRAQVQVGHKSLITLCGWGISPLPLFTIDIGFRSVRDLCATHKGW